MVVTNVGRGAMDAAARKTNVLSPPLLNFGGEVLSLSRSLVEASAYGEVVWS